MIAKTVLSESVEAKQQSPKQRKKLRVRRSGAAQRKLGRPYGILKKADTAKLIADVARGVPVDIACAAAGIHRDAFYSWLDQRPQFARELANENRRVISGTLDAIRSCSSKESEFRLLTWFLERVFPDAFAPQDKGFHLTQNNLVIGELDEARRILDAAKALPYRNGQNDN